MNVQGSFSCYTCSCSGSSRISGTSLIILCVSHFSPCLCDGMELAACKSSRTTVMSSQLYIQSTLYVYAYGVFGEGKKYVMLPDIL